MAVITFMMRRASLAKFQCYEMKNKSLLFHLNADILRLVDLNRHNDHFNTSTVLTYGPSLNLYDQLPTLIQISCTQIVLRFPRTLFLQKLSLYISVVLRVMELIFTGVKQCGKSMFVTWTKVKFCT